MPNDRQMTPPPRLRPVNRAVVAEAVDPVAHAQTGISNPMYDHLKDNDEEHLPDPHAASDSGLTDMKTSPPHELTVFVNYATPSGSQPTIYEDVNDDYAPVTKSAYNIGHEDTYTHLRPLSPPDLKLPHPMHPANPTTDAKPYDKIHRPSRSQLIKEVYYSLYDIISKNSDAQISNNRNITKTKEIQELIVTETQKPIINTPTEWFVQDGNG